ncbi:MAG TPA: DUF721 domain-containing protein [Candidatus Acidoferrales bacterium]
MNVLPCATIPEFEPDMEALAPIIRRWIEELESSWPEWGKHRLELMQALWPAVVGRSLARRTKPVAWRTHRLQVGVPDPAWRGQMETLAGPLLAAIRRWFPPLTVAALEFVVDENLGSSASPEENTTAGAGALSEAPPSAGTDLPLEAIGDEELRKLVAKVASRFFSLARC